MEDLLLHSRTKLNAEKALINPPQALLITGKDGSGKETLAHRLASKLLAVTPEKLSDHPYVLIIDPADKTISIDEIRSLQQFLKLKVPASNTTNRIVMVARAERMGAEAQNALLKTLEEPPIGTSLILTAERPDLLLKTITSRTQLLEILPVSKDSVFEYFSGSGISSAKLERAYALSNGQAGLLHALIGQQSHPLIDQVNLAKEILAEKPRERLLRTDELSKDKQGIKMLLEALYRISHAALSTASSKSNHQNVSQWLKREETVLQMIKAYGKNANPKLLLDNLFLNL